MESIQLNQTGNFDPWLPSMLDELNNYSINDSLGGYLMFEDERVKLWQIVLRPSERLPFRLQNVNYSWTCSSGGMALSRFKNGSIYLLRIEEMDTGYFEFKNRGLVSDFENIGKNVLEMDIVEYKNVVQENVIYNENYVNQ